MTEENKDFKYFVRIAQTDLDGNKSIGNSLLKIKGINFMFSNVLCKVSGIDSRKKTGYLPDQEVKKIDDVLKDLAKYNVPAWLFNRKRDPETGKDTHLFSANLTFTNENDIKAMKKIKCYKGMRHAFGLPVRGQKTKANFRRNKGKSSLGVKKKTGTKGGRV